MIERAPPVWPHHETGVVFALGHEDPEMRQRMDAAFAAMARDLGLGLYGDDDYTPPPTPTIRQRMRALRGRVSDAWLVLTGRAEIY